jgi:hypothetical protein
MDNGAAKGRACRPRLIDVDELVVIGGIRELVDPFLGNFEPR